MRKPAVPATLRNNMESKIDLNFLQKVQKSVEPDLLPGETAIEYLKRKENEKVTSLSQRQSPVTPTPEAPKPPVQEVVFYEGYKMNRDFFSCMALCIMKLDDPELNKIMESFGFEMKDLNGKPIVLKKRKKSKK